MGASGRSLRESITVTDRPVRAPARDVDRGAGLVHRRSAVPDRELLDLGVEISGAQHGVAHREVGAVREQAGLVEVGALGRECDTARGPEACVEAGDPLRSRVGDGDREELVLLERQGHVQLRAACEQCFGHENVGAGRERAVAEADVAILQVPIDVGAHRGLRGGGEPTGGPDAGDPVAGEVDHTRGVERSEDRGVDTGVITDQAQLAAGAGARRVVARCFALGLFERGARGGRVTEEQVGFGFRGREPIRVAG